MRLTMTDYMREAIATHGLTDEQILTCMEQKEGFPRERGQAAIDDVRSGGPTAVVLALAVFGLIGGQMRSAKQ